MHDRTGHGLSRSQQEYQLQWMLRQQPGDPAKLVEFIGDVVITLIVKNNEALERRAALEAPIDPPRAAS